MLINTAKYVTGELAPLALSAMALCARMFALLTQQLDKNTPAPSPCFSLSRVFLELGLILSPGVSSMLGGIPECAHATDHYQQAGITCLAQDPRSSTRV